MWARRWISLFAALAVLRLMLPSPAEAQQSTASMAAHVDIWPGDNVLQAGCSPRPRVRADVTRVGENKFSVTITAGQGALTLVAFGTAPTARLDLPGVGNGLTPPANIKPPAGATTYTFGMSSTSPSTPLTVPVTVADGCGNWSTFVGGGQAALQVGVSIGDAQVTEGDSGTKDLNFTVSLSDPSSQTVTVQYATQDGTATSPADFSAVSGTLTLAPGETSKTVTVQVKGDIIAELTETFEVRLSNASNATIKDGTATGTILDNEGQPSLSIANAQITEGDSGTQSLQFTVTLSGQSSQTVTVQYDTDDDTATSAQDYTTANGTLTFAPGETSKTFTVQIQGDTIDEPNERFFVRLFGATNASIGDDRADGAITDDDPTPTVSLSPTSGSFSESGGSQIVTATLSGQSSQSVTVSLGFGGTANSPGDFTTTAGQIVIPALSSSASITINAVNDAVFEGDETVIVDITVVTNATENGSQTATYTIVDDETIPNVTLSVSGSPFAEILGAATVTATLTNATTQTVTVTLGFSGTATNLTDYTRSAETITIDPLALTGTITLTGVDDVSGEGNETVIVEITGVTNAVEATPQSVTAIIADDDGPGVVMSGGSVSFTENGAPVVVDSGLSLTQGTGPNLVSATVTITNLLDGSAEALAATTAGTSISANYTSGTGVLALTGTDTIANYQQVLRTITYANSSDNPTTTARTISVQVTDPLLSSNTATRSVTVTATNDAPVLAAVEGGALAYTENDAATPVSSTITVTDPDSTTLIGGTVQITVGCVSFEDILALTPSPQNGITGTYDNSTCLLTLTGSASLANYQTALRSVLYSNSSQSPTTAPRTVTFRVDDGAGANNLSNQPTRSLNVSSVNDAPVLANIEGSGLSYTEADAPLTITAALTVSEVDSANLTGATVQITGNCASGEDVLALNPSPQNGITGTYTAVSCSLALSGSASLASYQTALQAVQYSNTSNGPSTLTRTVTFQVNDGQGLNNLSNTQTRQITVVSTNTAPVLANLEGALLAYTENAPPAAVTSTLTVTDVDSPNLAGASVQISSGCVPTEDVLALAPSPQNGITGMYTAATCSLALTGSASQSNYQTALRAVTYSNTSNTPNVGARTLSFQIDDGSASNNLSNVPTRSLTVTAANDAPILAAVEGTALTFTEGDAATNVTSAITVSDGDGSTITGGTVEITTNCVPAEDVLALNPSPQNGITGTYAAGSCSLALSGTTTLANYQTALRAVQYQNTNVLNPSTASRTLTFQVDDGQSSNNLSNQPTRSITVVGVNDASVLAGIEGAAASYTEDGAATQVTNAITVSDVDSSTLAGATVRITTNCASSEDVLTLTPSPQNGITGTYTAGTCTLALTGTSSLANYQAALRAVSYSNSSDDPSTLTRTVSVTVNDGGSVNTTSNTLTRNVSVTAVNDAPTANGFTNLPAQAGIKITYPAGKLGGTDVEAGTTITINTTPDSVCSNCALTIRADGGFDFTPPPSAAGSTVSFTYHVSDNGIPGGGVSSSPATVSFSVAGPAIYFVKSSAAGAGTCSLSNECTLATALSTIGGGTNARIFINDSVSYASAVTLNSGGWLIGPGVTGTTFDSLFGISTPAQGTLATRPSLASSRPTVQGTVTLNASSAVRGLNITPSVGSQTGLTDIGSSISGVTVSDVSVTTTTGTAVLLSDTGGSLSFTSISTNGAANGISLTNTTGSFTVTGNSGTCTAATPTCTGGSILSSTNAGILLSNVQNVSLTRMRISGSTNFGLSGSTVNSMTIDSTVFDGTHGGAIDEGALFVTNWLGSGTISNSEILGGFNDNVRINNTTGTLNRLTVSNTTIRNSGNNHGLAFYTCLGGGAGSCSGVTMNLTVQNSTFDNNSSNHIDIGAKGLASLNAVITGNTLTTDNTTVSQPYGGAVNLTVDHSAILTFDVGSNQSTYSRLTPFNFFSSNQTSSTSRMTGRVHDNSAGLQNTVGSGSLQGSGLMVTATGDAAVTINIDNNDIYNWATNNGIDVSAGDGGANGPDVNLTVTGNTLGLTTPTVNQLHGISTNIGTTSTGGNVSACVDIGGAGPLENSVVGAGSVPSSGSDVRVRQRSTSTVRLPGFGGTTDIVAYIQGRNVGDPSVSSAGTFSGGGSCVQAP